MPWWSTYTKLLFLKRTRAFILQLISAHSRTVLRETTIKTTSHKNYSLYNYIKPIKRCTFGCQQYIIRPVRKRSPWHYNVQPALLTGVIIVTTDGIRRTWGTPRYVWLVPSTDNIYPSAVATAVHVAVRRRVVCESAGLNAGLVSVVLLRWPRLA